MSMHRVVVGVDFSASSIRAAEWASRELAPETEVVLAHVMSLPKPPPIMRGRYPKHALTADTLRLGADQKLSALARTMVGRRVWPALLEGDASAELVEVAKAYDAGLIILGAHDSAARFDLGSTARELVGKATVPILVLDTKLPSRPFRFLLPVEQEESAGWAIDFLRLLANDGDRVTLLHVTPAAVMTHVLARGGGEQASDEEPGGQASDKWMRLAHDGPWGADQVTSEESFGDAAQEIRAAAARQDASFVVLPRRNSGRVRRALLGSVTAAIVNDPPCSVIIVPERRSRG